MWIVLVIAKLLHRPHIFTMPNTQWLLVRSFTDTRSEHVFPRGLGVGGVGGIHSCPRYEVVAMSRLCGVKNVNYPKTQTPHRIFPHPGQKRPPSTTLGEFDSCAYRVGASTHVILAYYVIPLSSLHMCTACFVLFRTPIKYSSLVTLCCCCA